MAYFLGFALAAAIAVAPFQDHGTHGKTFPIEEEDLLDYLGRSMHTLDHKRLQKHYTSLFQRPRAVDSLKEATISTVHYVDPTVVLKEDIKDAQGQVIVCKGAAYNPLVHFSLTQDLLFFDGDLESHVQWAKNNAQEAQWILAGGSPAALEETEGRPVFFDQGGVLVKRLSITALPARVSQEGTRLKVESIPVGSLCDF